MAIACDNNILSIFGPKMEVKKLQIMSLISRHFLTQFDEQLVTSSKMEKFLGGIKLIDRNKVMHSVWAYIVQHDLMGPYVKNAKITTDKKLRTLFGQRAEVNRLQIRSLISRHFPTRCTMELSVSPKMEKFLCERKTISRDDRLRIFVIYVLEMRVGLYKVSWNHEPKGTRKTLMSAGFCVLSGQMSCFERKFSIANKTGRTSIYWVWKCLEISLGICNGFPRLISRYLPTSRQTFFPSRWK